MREVIILTKAIMRRWNHDKSKNYKIKSYTVIQNWTVYVNFNFFIMLAFLGVSQSESSMQLPHIKKK